MKVKLGVAMANTNAMLDFLNLDCGIYVVKRKPPQKNLRWLSFWWSITPHIRTRGGIS